MILRVACLPACVRARCPRQDMTQVDLGATLPSSLVMVVTVTGSTTQTAPLSAEDLGRAFEGCDEAEYLANCKVRAPALGAQTHKHAREAAPHRANPPAAVPTPPPNEIKSTHTPHTHNNNNNKLGCE